MSHGKHTAGKKNGTAEVARIGHLERRLLTSEAAEQRMHIELLKAHERAEDAEREAAQAEKLHSHLQVLASH